MKESDMKTGSAAVHEADVVTADQKYQQQFHALMREIDRLLPQFDDEFLGELVRESNQAFMGRNIATTINGVLGHTFSEILNNPQVAIEPDIQFESNQQRVDLAESVHVIITTIIELMSQYGNAPSNKIKIRNSWLCQEASKDLMHALFWIWAQDKDKTWRQDEPAHKRQDEMLKKILQEFYSFWRSLYQNDAI